MATNMNGTNEKAFVVERKGWRKMLPTRRKELSSDLKTNSVSSDEERPIEKWTMGILNDKKTEEVPGTILLLSAKRNEPLGLRHAPAHQSASSLPSPFLPSSRPSSARSGYSAKSEKKKTADGKILLEPQPDDSLNDPLNWPTWRRDSALLSLGFYCMLGGGLTPVLAAGFQNVADDYNVSYSRVALTTGFFMMGMGVGSVIFSPTAILFGKRPVYLGSAICLIVTSIWCAASPSYASLAAARVFQGISVSPVECLPSATIAEIFFLHERAFRIGVYTLLLLSGKNLVPLASAAVINSLGWPWVFWIYAIVVAFGGSLLFAFVPETFWDRTPHPKKKRPHIRSLTNLLHSRMSLHGDQTKIPSHDGMTPRQERLHRYNVHVEFAEAEAQEKKEGSNQHADKDDYFLAMDVTDPAKAEHTESQRDYTFKTDKHDEKKPPDTLNTHEAPPTVSVIAPDGTKKIEELQGPSEESEKNKVSNQIDGSSESDRPVNSQLSNPGKKKPANLTLGNLPSFSETINKQKKQDEDHNNLTLPGTLDPLPNLRNFNSPYYLDIERNSDYLTHRANDSKSGRRLPFHRSKTSTSQINAESHAHNHPLHRSKTSISQISTEHPIHNHRYIVATDIERGGGPTTPLSQKSTESPTPPRYTAILQSQPPKTFVQALKPWNGRLNHSNWLKVLLRPFVLFTFPSVLWSALVYSLSIGWLIVLSESVSDIYRNKSTYNFSALGTGLVYISPFIGGVLGTAVAGRVSDIIVRYLARRNGGIYEPEFRLVMAIPVAVSTAIGLMGFGWSAEERDQWIVPTLFFGIISFGCSLGSTTAITFCVDSYRQYAGEALVTLNFAKNIFHGLVFSLFFANWLESDGPKKTFLAIGGIQVACLFSTIPMYIYGKRARMWTVRKAWMNRL